MTPEYLEELADIADPDRLWRGPIMHRPDLPEYKRRQLDAGVALRRYASHLRRMDECLKEGRSLLLTPLSPNGTAVKSVETPPEHARLHRRPLTDVECWEQGKPDSVDRAMAYEEVLTDHRRLVRELDVLLNGEAGAAMQASLVDIVSQVRTVKQSAKEMRAALVDWYQQSDGITVGIPSELCNALTAYLGPEMGVAACDDCPCRDWCKAKGKCDRGRTSGVSACECTLASQIIECKKNCVRNAGVSGARHNTISEHTPMDKEIPNGK